MEPFSFITFFSAFQICTAVILYDSNYLNYNNRNGKKCVTTCYAPGTGFTTETTYGGGSSHGQDSLGYKNRQRDYGGNLIINLGSYTSQSKCKYQKDVIIDDGVARTASTSERLMIDKYRREMRDYNNRQYGSNLEKGFTQLYGQGLPFLSESSAAPKPPCFCAYCKVVVVEDDYK